MSSLVNLVRFLPDNDDHVAELVRQRVLCGWDDDKVEAWRKNVRDGDRILYWIFPADPATFVLPETQDSPPPPTPAFQPLGHVGLDTHDPVVNDPLLTNREKGYVKLVTFFVLGSLQGKGLGNAVMDEVERLAASPPINAKRITLTTFAGRVMRDPAHWTRVGGVYNPSARVNEEWYARRGYKAFKEAPLFPGVDVTAGGASFTIDGVYMAKDL